MTFSSWTTYDGPDMDFQGSITYIRSGECRIPCVTECMGVVSVHSAVKMHSQFCQLHTFGNLSQMRKSKVVDINLIFSFLCMHTLRKHAPIST